MSWDEKAACKSVDTEIFFSKWDLPEAKSICAECPVKTLCLQAALDMEGDASRWHRFGIYGGKTSSERVRISKGHQVPPGIRGTTSRRCVKCGTLMESVGNSRQYCDDCQAERGRERDREYRARKKARTGGGAA